MKLIKPESDFLALSDGNAMTLPERIVELLKSDIYPIVLEFDSLKDVQLFAEAVRLIK